MTLTVTLFRHAKSSWDDVALSDFDRPLSERGERDAPRMAAWLRAEQIAPDLVLCSTAQRTQQTLALIRTAWPDRVEVRLVEALYMADASVVLASLRDAPPARRHVMVIGHNPGLEGAAKSLVGAGTANVRQTMATKFPTAACAVITFAVTAWTAVAAGGGTLTHWMTPRGLGG